MSSSPSSTPHPFETAPHKTMLRLSIPIVFSLIAEPLTGLVDTAFVAQLGAAPLAALGIGTTALSSLFWVFNFLGIGTQTEVAQKLGRDRPHEAARMSSLAYALAAGFGLLTVLIVWPAAEPIAVALGAEGEVLTGAVDYMRVRLFGGPAVLLALVAFGGLRGLQDMRTPSLIAVTINVLNMALDPLLIFGWGPIPAMGIRGAAVASVISQWLGGGWALLVVQKRLPFVSRLSWAEAGRLLRVGGDLFMRTGLLMAFLLLSTRVANRIGVEAGAAYQAIRQVWIFAALVLEAFATTAQSLVGYFLGADRPTAAKRVAAVSMGWSLVTGVGLWLGMWAGTDWVAVWLVPPTAVGVFTVGWQIAAVTQPLNAAAFITDGVHWGTGDYRFLRNAMLAATAVGAAGLWLVDVDTSQTAALRAVWIVTGVWILVRAATGVLRIWPGIGRARL